MKFTLKMLVLFLIAGCASTSGDRGPAAKDPLECAHLIGKFFDVEDQILSTISKKQSKLGYSIKGKALYKTIDGKKVLIGEVEVIKPRFLFEWQEKDMHDYWIKNKGITKHDMDFILSEPGQNYGRGYYVSLDPIDSAHFGSHLTIFEVNKPMVVIKDLSLTFYNDETILNELRSIGYAGNRGTPTWFNLFNENYLQDAKRLDGNNLPQILTKENGVAPFSFKHLQMKPSIGGIVAKINKDLMKKLTAGKSLSAQEETIFFSDSEHFFHLKDNAFFQKYVSKAFRIIEDTSVYLRAMKIWDIKPEQQVDYVKKYRKVMDNLPYANEFFELYDLVDLKKINYKHLDAPSFEQMMDTARRYKEQLDKVNLNKVLSSEDFKEALTEILENDFEIRDVEAIRSAYEKEKFTFTMRHENAESLKGNYFNSMISMKKKGHTNEHLGEYEISYFGKENFNVLAKLLTPEQKKEFDGLLLKNKKSALRFANTAIYEMLFSPQHFEKIIKAFDPQETVTPFSLYKVFVALHPFQNDNKRASRIYYRWLVENHFKNADKQLKIPLYDAEFFYRSADLTATSDINWYLSRLWAIHAPQVEAMSTRAGGSLGLDVYYSRAGSLMDIQYMDEKK